MGISISEILKHLDTKDETLKAMIRSFGDCKTRPRADELIKDIKCKEDEYASDFRAAGQKPFCSILFAAAHFISRRYAQATEHLQDAERGFACSGQAWNLAMARWMHALIHQKTNNADRARLEFDKASLILARLSLEYRRMGRYEDSELCQSLIGQIRESASAEPEQAHPPEPPGQGRPKKAQAPPPSPSTSPSSKPPTVRSQPVIFPVYDPVSAGEGGDFIFDSQPQGLASIRELTIDEKPFHIFSMREAEPVILRPRIYRWLYVVGDSMNRSSPHPLIEGDCILVVETDSAGLVPKANDIVVAALLDPAKPVDRAGVVKRYTPQGLCSESSQTYPRIPLKKAKVRGIVLAVAKPVKAENIPHPA